RVARALASMLRPFDVDVPISDPYVGDGMTIGLGAKSTGLESLFCLRGVVSLHAPDIPSTRGIVTSELLVRMREGTTFINTVRVTFVDSEALRAELMSGRLSAVLDVHEDLSPNIRCGTCRPCRSRRTPQGRSATSCFGWERVPSRRSAASGLVFRH